jgi:hypothetical protein
MHRGFGWLTLKEKDQLKVLDVDGRIKLKLILKEINWGGHGLSWSGSGWGQLVGCSELLGILKCRIMLAS